jgi:hypothetical protein
MGTPVTLTTGGSNAAFWAPETKRRRSVSRNAAACESFAI